MAPIIMRQLLDAKVDVNLITKLKRLESNKRVPFNALVEEAFKDLLNKYEQQ
jgi:hypothetical protein